MRFFSLCLSFPPSSLQISGSFLDDKKRLLVSSLNSRACIHGVIKVTCMVWHTSIAFGEGVKLLTQHPFGVIPRGGLVRLASFSTAALFLSLKRRKLQCVSFEAVGK